MIYISKCWAIFGLPMIFHSNNFMVANYGSEFILHGTIIVEFRLNCVNIYNQMYVLSLIINTKY